MAPSPPPGNAALAPLANILWHCLTGAQASIGAGGPTAKRYARGYSPIAAFADLSRPDFAALAPHVQPGESFYVGGFTGPVPDGWTLEFDSTMFQMVWHGPVPDARAIDAVPLDTRHADAMVALAELTHPGPFGPRTVEMGRYLGVIEDGRLVAMAGERMHAGRLREVSGVATHPDRQGRGLARALMERLLHEQIARGEIPFLHVMRNNELACALYRRMGFREHQELPVRRIARNG